MFLWVNLGKTKPIPWILWATKSQSHPQKFCHSSVFLMRHEEGESGSIVQLFHLAPIQEYLNAAPVDTKWAPTNYKWSSYPYKWPCTCAWRCYNSIYD